MSVDTRSAAEAMDGMYRYQRYIYDATRRYFLFGRDEMLARLKPPRGGTVLEIGCGTGRNLVHACRKYPEARFYGVDVSREMLISAEVAVGRLGVQNRVQLAHADATRLSLRDTFSINNVDRIFLSYVLSMIPDWPQVIDRALAALAPHGQLHIVDFGAMQSMPAPARLALQAWLAHFGVDPRVCLRTVGERAAARHLRQLTHYEGRLGYAAHAIIG